MECLALDVVIAPKWDGSACLEYFRPEDEHSKAKLMIYIRI